MEKKKPEIPKKAVKIKRKLVAAEIPVINSSGSSKQRRARMLAVQALYAAESCGIKSESEIGELCSFPWDDSGAGKEITDQAALLVRGSFAVLPEIDAKIKQRLINWDFSRISIVNKSILRLSIYSMLYEKSSPSRLIINEAVDLAKIFSDEEGYKFINALLDRLRKDEESKAPPA